MRSDFNKLLTESPRLGSTKSFHNVRHNKRTSRDDEVGGREGMKREHYLNYGRSGGTKYFNENLSPLYRFLLKSVGRPWNKIYSEIRKNFDARKVINAHILQHLYEYVADKTDVKDGVIISVKNNDRRYDVLEFYDFYVHPITGLLKATNRDTSFKREMRKAKAKREADVAAFRIVVDKEHELIRHEDGTWFLYTIKERPPKEIVYVKPEGVDLLDWLRLTKPEQAQVGIETLREVNVRDVLDRDIRKKIAKKQPFINAPRMNCYYASKQTASKAVLKKHGLSRPA